MQTAEAPNFETILKKTPIKNFVMAEENSCVDCFDCDWNCEECDGCDCNE